MVYYLLIAVTLVIFVLLHVCTFPSLFLSARSLSSGDRAVKDVKEAGGRSIIYTPADKYRKYIKHYVLSQRDGKMQFTCEFDKNLRYIEYDIRMFNSKGKIFKIFTIKEMLEDGVAPATIYLDNKTAYVNVAVRAADDQKFAQDKVRKVSRGGIFLYFLCTTITEIVCAYAVKICIAKLYGGVYHESFLLSGESTLITLAACAVMIILNVVITCVSLKKFIRGRAARIRGHHA